MRGQVEPCNQKAGESRSSRSSPVALAARAASASSHPISPCFLALVRPHHSIVDSQFRI
jgi:hypothetical protein